MRAAIGSTKVVVFPIRGALRYCCNFNRALEPQHPMLCVGLSRSLLPENTTALRKADSSAISSIEFLSMRGITSALTRACNAWNLRQRHSYAHI